MTTDTATVVERTVHGRFDLRQSIDFGFGQRDAEFGDVMRLAFCLDGYQEQVAATITQPSAHQLAFKVFGEADPEAVADHASRVLSVDVDARGYDELVDADPLLSRVQQARPGLRPPLFYSAYEGLIWAVLSARRPEKQMAKVRERLSMERGRVFDIEGRQLAAMPTPEQLLAVSEFPGIPEFKLTRMKAIAEAARDGTLDTPTLRSRDPAEVSAELRRFDGIGPFYSDLITVRTLGHTDELTLLEPRVVALTAQLLGRDELSPTEFKELAERWRPWRTWALVSIRAGGAGALEASERPNGDP